MAALSKNLTVMFVDIKGYTKRSQEQTRSQNQQLIQAFGNTVQPVIQQRGGQIIKGLGDAFLITFESSTDAVLAGMDIQKKIHQINQQGLLEFKLEVRVALCAGDIRIEDNDIFGDAVNIAARVEGITPENQVYFTESVFHTMNKNEIPHQEVGKIDLRGISASVTVYKALWGDGAIKHPDGKAKPSALSSQLFKGILAPGELEQKPDFKNLDNVSLKKVNINSAVEKAIAFLCRDQNVCQVRPQFFALGESSEANVPEPYFSYALLSLLRFTGLCGSGQLRIMIRTSAIRTVDIKTNKKILKALSKRKPELKNMPVLYEYRQHATSIHVDWSDKKSISDPSNFIKLWDQIVASGIEVLDLDISDFFQVLCKSGATIRGESEKGNMQRIVVKIADVSQDP